MNTTALREHFANCPYCGENISVLIDTSLDEQSYIEDCEVCCRPMTVRISTRRSQELDVELLQETEVG